MFIAVEGIDGAGKTTTVTEIERFLLRRGYTVHRTSEPTSGDSGRAIRALLSGDGDRAYLHHELALLFAADRLRHLADEIEPALAAGKTVLTDRYLFSSLAYQSAVLPSEWVRELNRFALLPDVVVYIGVSLDTACARIAATRQKTELFEKRVFLERLLDNYERVIVEYGDRICVVRLDGEVRMEEIAGDVEKRLGGIFPPKLQ